MPSPKNQEDSRHSPFLDLCLLYGDFNRPVFLDAILHWFLESASPAELKSLRRAIRDRARSLHRSSKPGRPRGAHDRLWIRSSTQLVWRREILRWPWRKIATASSLEPTKENIRTLRNRRDQYAILVWNAAMGAGAHTHKPETLRRLLKALRIRRWFRSRLALPFAEYPEECRRIVLALAPRGAKVAAKLR